MNTEKMKAKIWEEKVTIPTYGIGTPDKNPMFLEKRVYQGSSGKVYPYPVIDKILDSKKDKEYNAVYLENEYLKVMVLPELGGRIHRAYDKTNGYDFVYYNEVIKPALVGLLGPWISGGIEFNWPQHHRPSTFLPVDHAISENDDGSVSVRVSEVDRMYGTKGMATFTLHPGKAYIEIKGQLYNGTPLPQTFLWWANPAVSVNDDTQSIFPPDVHAVMDHGKRDVSKFPVATGVYYKQDYGAGVDISRYKNIPVPTSYMAYHSDFNFVGGYDYGKDAGILHVADHHVSPGKKQWTWGCGEFGKAWDRNLTDANGPYIELMTGVFTDNQPDFTWLKPFEEKSFTQYFMPYKKIGGVKNANAEIVMGLDVADGVAKLSVYSTSERESVRVTLSKKNQIVFEKTSRLSPVDVLAESAHIGAAVPQDLFLSAYDDKGNLLLSYRPAGDKIEKIPEAAQRAKVPAEIPTNEELYLTGLHIEQYRHATFDPDPYYLEGLKRDPGDSRINAAYGLLLLRRGQFAGSELYFRKAIERISVRNTNPYSGEPHYFLGLSLLYQDRLDEAFDSFYKATWVGEQQEMSFYYLAAISSRRGEIVEAFSFIERSLIKNSHNVKARALKAYLLRTRGNSALAKKMIAENLALDPFDFVSGLEAGLSDGAMLESTLRLMRDNEESFIAASIWYAEWGAYADAIRTLWSCHGSNPMLSYYEGLFYERLGDPASAHEALSAAAKRSPLYCFPNRLEDIGALRYAIAESPMDAKARYYLANLFYDRKNYAEAISLWERSVDLDPDYPTAWRNLAIAYYNKAGEREKSRQAMERAYTLDPKDARVFFELDQLYRKERVVRADRLKNFAGHQDIVNQRDDLYVEFVNLLNLAGRQDEAFDLLMKRKFHPWEGGEGKVTSQYVAALLLKAKSAIGKKEYQKAVALLRDALSFPENLGEGKLSGTNDNDVYYFLGCALEGLGKKDEAVSAWERASAGNQEPAGMMFYNDQPAHYIFYQGLALEKLGKKSEALSRFNKLKDYGEKHIFDAPTIDYFAVSLPDLQLFDDDLAKRNESHCHFLIALGLLGLSERAKARHEFQSTLKIDEAHAGAILQMRLNDLTD